MANCCDTKTETMMSHLIGGFVELDELIGLALIDHRLSASKARHRTIERIPFKDSFYFSSSKITLISFETLVLN